MTKIYTLFETLGTHHFEFNIFNIVGDIWNPVEIKPHFLLKRLPYGGSNVNGIWQTKITVPQAGSLLFLYV